MMGNNPFQTSSSGQHRNLDPAPSLSESFPWSEGEERDWSFRDFLGILRRRALVVMGVASLIMTTSIISLMNQKAEYESSFRLLVEAVNDDSKALDIVKDQNQNSGKSSLDYESQIQVLKSPELVQDIIKRLKKLYTDVDYSTLVNSLTITRLGETKIIEVRYRGQNREAVEIITNQIAKEYLRYSLEKRQTKLRQGMSFVEKQLPLIQLRVDRIQKDLQRFRQKNDFIDPESQTQQINSKITGLSDQRLVIDQKLAQARDNLANLQQQNGELAALNDAPVYQQLIVQVRQLEAQIGEASSRFQAENPTIQALKDKKDSLLLLLSQEAQRSMNVKTATAANQLQALEVQNQELAKAELELEQKRKQLPVLNRQYTEMQRGLQVATESLNRFLATRENLQIQIAQTELPWQLIQPPSKPTTAASSDVKRSLLMGLLGSLALGIGAAVLIEKLDNTYHTAVDLKDKIKLPLLGIIPFEKQQEQNRAIKQKVDPKASMVGLPNLLRQGIVDLAPSPQQDYNTYSAKFIEALRVLYTNIQFLSSDRPIRSIVISSAMAGDGKSTVAFNLAQIAATMGQRVLLVDADMRQPEIHKLSNLNNLWGLSNLISTNLPLGEVLRQMPAMKQLSVITSGPIPPDPTKLLSSEKMKLLMSELHNSFDLVIYDAPELVGLADASLLIPNTNGILLVVRMDKTDSSVFKRALDSLKLSRLNVLGVIGNAQKNN
jgi:polysaccharide biosynthesis transport protein